LGGVAGHAGDQEESAQAQANACARQSGAERRTPYGAHLGAKNQNGTALSGEGGLPPNSLTPRSPLLVLVASAGRPGPRSVLGEATANGEAFMNAESAAGNSFLRRSINGAGFAGAQPTSSAPAER
jgi:hypothetical protein